MIIKYKHIWRHTIYWEQSITNNNKNIVYTSQYLHFLVFQEASGYLVRSLLVLFNQDTHVGFIFFSYRQLGDQVYPVYQSFFFFFLFLTVTLAPPLSALPLPSSYSPFCPSQVSCRLRGHRGLENSPPEEQHCWDKVSRATQADRDKVLPSAPFFFLCGLMLQHSTCPGEPHVSILFFQQINQNPVFLFKTKWI